MRSGKLLGYLVTQRGIEANPKKIRAIQEMEPPKNKREVQRLAGRLAALSRFISRSTERSLSFFKVLRGADPYRWTEEQEVAFRELKAYLQHPEILTSPAAGAPLLLYIVAAEGAVSAVLAEEQKREGRIMQAPVYYVSEALVGAKQRYSEMEKMVYAVVMASQKLKHYFTAHAITVPTTYPIRDMFENKEAVGHVGKWAVELNPYNIKFVPRSAIQS